jgi:hypothetical protein
LLRGRFEGLAMVLAVIQGFGTVTEATLSTLATAIGSEVLGASEMPCELPKIIRLISQ